MRPKRAAKGDSIPGASPSTRPEETTKTPAVMAAASSGDAAPACHGVCAIQLYMSRSPSRVDNLRSRFSHSISCKMHYPI